MLHRQPQRSRARVRLRGNAAMLVVVKRQGPARLTIGAPPEGVKISEEAF